MKKLLNELKTLSIDSDPVRFLAVAYSIRQEIEKQEKKAKEIILKNFPDDVKFDDLQVKVLVTDSPSKTIYNMEQIIDGFRNARKLAVLSEIVTIVKKNVNGNLTTKLKSIVESNSQIVPGDGKTVQVRKLSKND